MFGTGVGYENNFVTINSRAPHNFPSMLWSSKKRRNKEPCKKYACLIQRCLEVNNYDAKSCSDSIDALRRCCEGIRHNSTHCSTYLPGPAYSNTVADQPNALGAKNHKS